MIIFNKFLITYIIRSIYGLAIGYTIVMFIAFLIYYYVFRRQEKYFWDWIDDYLKDKSIELEMSKMELLINWNN